MSSAAEAEIGALFLNSRQAIPARTTLIKMGHHQPPTPIQTDNTTALEFVGKNLTPKAAKSTDMQFWWMRDRSDQKQFRYYWGPGKYNRADYWTKHFCAAHHCKKRPAILTPRTILDKLRAARGSNPFISGLGLPQECARHVISVRVNPKTNVGLEVPRAGTSLSWIPDPETGK